MTGFQDEIRDRILGVNPHILIVNIAGDIRNPERLSRCSRKRMAFPGSAFVTFQGMAQSGRQVAGTVVKGMNPQDLSFLNHLVKDGNIEALSTKGTCW
jgi:lipoprotein-releasing system permease protein